MVKLSVIIATRNRAAAIVERNGATGSPFPVRLLSEPKAGWSRAHNRALRAAQGQLLAITDDDCHFSRDYVNKLGSTAGRGRPMAHISVVVPIFREELTLHELYRRLREPLSAISEDFEILLVSDGGRDRSWDIIRDLSAADPRVKGVKFTRNFGQHLAISAGLDVCDGDWVVVMDGDLQDRPEVIPELYAKAQEGYDVVFVSRLERPESAIYQLAARLFYKIFKLLASTDYDPAHANFSIISRRVVEQYRMMGESLRFYGLILDWLGFQRTSIEAQHGARYAGTSGYNLRKRLLLAYHIILAHSDRPLHFSIAFGLLISLWAGGTGIWMVTRYLFFGQYSVTGWTSLIVSTFFIGGIILMVLGVMGIYIGKIFNEIKGRPLYVVEEKVGLDDSRRAAPRYTRAP
jgi:glycosyltransferase involved in cell wall biosynthesis